MKCAYCSFQETKVVETRESSDSTRRRRECLNCSKRFTTYERAASSLTVIKKNKEKEKFEVQKLIAGLTKACEKTSITPEQIEVVAEQVKQQLYAQDSTEIRSAFIGHEIMKQLKKLDKVAYLRFASVHKEYDVEKLQKEIGKLV